MNNVDPTGEFYASAARCALNTPCRTAVVDATAKLIGVAAVLSRRTDPFVVRVQAQGRKVGEHSMVLRGNTPIPADEVRTALVALQDDLGNRQLRLLSPAFANAQTTVDNAEASGGVPQGFSKSHYVPGVPGADARVDIESILGNGNIGPSGGKASDKSRGYKSQQDREASNQPPKLTNQDCIRAGVTCGGGVSFWD